MVAARNARILPMFDRRAAVLPELTPAQLETMNPAITLLAAQRLEKARRLLRTAHELVMAACCACATDPSSLSELRHGIENTISEMEAFVLDPDRAEAWVGTAFEGLRPQASRGRRVNIMLINMPTLIVCAVGLVVAAVGFPLCYWRGRLSGSRSATRGLLTLLKLRGNLCREAVEGIERELRETVH